MPKGIPERRISYLLLAIMAAIFSGCAGRQMVITTPEGYNSPEAALEAVEPPLLNGILTATAKIEITNQGERYPMKAVLMIKAPSFFRLESIPLIGLPDLFVSLHAGEMRIYIPSRQCFCIGPATSGNIAKFLPIDMEAEMLVPVLLGNSPELAVGSFLLSGKMEGNLYRVDQIRKDANFSVWIDPSADKIVRMVFRRNDGNIYEVIYENHLSVEGVTLPQSITINTRNAKKMTIKYLDAQIIPDMKESFILPCPDGMNPSYLH